MKDNQIMNLIEVIEVSTICSRGRLITENAKV